MKILLGSTTSKRKVRVTITTTKRSVMAGQPEKEPSDGLLAAQHAIEELKGVPQLMLNGSLVDKDLPTVVSVPPSGSTDE